MSKLNLSNFAKNISAKLGANAPGITIGLGTGAILVAGVMVGVATPKAMKLIEDAQVAKTKRFETMKEKAPDDAVMDETDELTWVEIIKAGWKPYAPAIMTAVVGVACIVGGTRANARRKDYERFYNLLNTIFYICNLAGFHVEGRIVLTDKKTGKVWK